MLHWWVMFAISMTIVTLSLLLAYGYPPFSKWNLRTDFWTERYDKVGEGDDEVKGVGLMLEFSLPLILWLSLLFLSGLIYKEAGRQFFEEDLTSWVPWVIGGIVLIGVGYYSFIMSRREHEQLLRDQESEAFKALLPDVQARLCSLREVLDKEGRLEEEVGKLNRPYRAYVLYSWSTFTLLLLYGWIIGSGFVGDLKQVIHVYRDFDPLSLAVDFQGVSEQFLLAGEAFYLELGALQGSFGQFAMGIAGILGTSMLVMFWFLGTRYQSIYTQDAVTIGRQLARVVVVVLPLLLLVCYVGYAAKSFEITSTLDQITDSIRPADQTARDLERFSNLSDRIAASSTFESFWSQLASSSGGLLVLAGMVFSFWQNKTRSWSFLRQLSPQGLDFRGSKLLKAMRSVPLPTDFTEEES